MQVIYYTWFTRIRSVNLYIYINKRHPEHLGPDGTIPHLGAWRHLEGVRDTEGARTAVSQDPVRGL